MWPPYQGAGLDFWARHAGFYGDSSVNVGHGDSFIHHAVSSGSFTNQALVEGSKNGAHIGVSLPSVGHVQKIKQSKKRQHREPFRAIRHL